MDRELTRRATLGLGGGLAAAAVLAGCTEGGGDPEENGDGLEDEGDDASPTEADWEDVDTIELEADDDVWIGREPAAIDGHENPDLVLLAGSEYEFHWTNPGERRHSLAVGDEDGPVESTAFAEGESDPESLTVEATEELEVYFCESHTEEMTGSIEVRTE